MLSTEKYDENTLLNVAMMAGKGREYEATLGAMVVEGWIGRWQGERNT